GVRSAFQGKVDVPENPQEADSLPFYILVTGPACDVRYAIATLRDKLQIPSADRFEMVFTQRMVAHVERPLAVSPASPAFRITPYDKLVPDTRHGTVPVLANVNSHLELKVDSPMVPEYAGAEAVEPSGPDVRPHVRVRVTAFRGGQEEPDAEAGQALS